MEPSKDIEKVKRMFAQGLSAFVDPQTGYKYTMAACCPKDGNFASVARTERVEQSLSRVTFRCASCFTEFDAGQDDIYVR